jgi:shikimate dehydrogenase
MTKLYGLIGHPLGHSFSEHYFNEKFAAESIDAEYRNFDIENVREFKRIISDNPTLCGMNVTLPHKVNVIPLLDSITDNARDIGAVNVIKFRRNAAGKLHLEGHNSDVVGFKQSLEPLLDARRHKMALVLGTGGASKAIFHGLKQLGLTATYVSRTKKDFCLTYNEITKQLLEQYTVIVNATPLGMYPNTETCPDIPYEYLTKEHILYDLIYNPDETLFMKKGKARNATVKNGLEMLLLQAFISWQIWNR